VASLFHQIRVLENKYNGPIPIAERDSALYRTPESRRYARQAIRDYHRRCNNDIEASRQWRVALAAGCFKQLTPIRELDLRIGLCQTMLLTVSQTLAWRMHLRDLLSAESGHG
jgi:hypothetical protein